MQHWLCRAQHVVPSGWRRGCRESFVCCGACSLEAYSARLRCCARPLDQVSPALAAVRHEGYARVKGWDGLHWLRDGLCHVFGFLVAHSIRRERSMTGMASVGGATASNENITAQRSGRMRRCPARGDLSLPTAVRRGWQGEGRCSIVPRVREHPARCMTHELLAHANENFTWIR